jgi:drug/metabolite transporter (DMT)-like permease
MSFASIGQKMITRDKMPVAVQNFYLGVYNGLPGFIMCVYDLHFGVKDIKYVLYCASNGLVFLAGHYLTSISYKYIAISKFLPVTYLVVVFTFILSVSILKEPLFFTDIVGASLIIGFQFYNLTYPPKRNNLNETNINKEKTLNDFDKNNRISDTYIINRISVDSKD